MENPSSPLLYFPAFLLFLVVVKGFLVQQMLVEPLMIKVDYFHASYANTKQNSPFELINMSLFQVRHHCLVF